VTESLSNEELRKLLTDLGPERLADSLLELAVYDNYASNLVNQLTASPADNIDAYKAKLKELKNSIEYIDWRGASDFARQLEQILADLSAGCDDPKTGVELVAAFFEADAAIFEHCDDSSGDVGMVFDCDACDLFVQYASDYPDKSRLIDRIIGLCESDDYGVRDALIKAAHRFLSKDDLHALAKRIDERSKLPGESWHWLRALVYVARQIKHPRGKQRGILE
jgi:hypothetical protein